MKIKTMINGALFFAQWLKQKIKNGKKISTVGFDRIQKNVIIDINRGKCVFGRKVMVSPYTRISVVNGVLSVGDNVFFNRNNNISCYDSITIGDNTIFGPNVCIYDQNHIFDANGVTDGFRTSPIVIGNNCWIASNVVILKGVKIGDGVIIGAGCIIKHDIPSHSLVELSSEMKIKTLLMQGEPK